MAQKQSAAKKKTNWFKEKLSIRLSEFSQIHQKYTNLKPEQFYNEYEGLLITDIDIKVIDPVGLSIDKPENDSLSKFAKFINKVTFNTPKSYAYRMLLFKEGDLIDASVFAQTEKNIRLNPHNKDILIKVIPYDSIYARVEVILQDKLSGYISPEFSGERIGIGISYSSLLGLPIEMSQNVALNYDPKNIFHYNGNIFWTQLGKSRVRIGPDISINRRNQFYGIVLEKPFISENTRWAGRCNSYYIRNGINYDNQSPNENHVFRNESWLAVSLDPKIKNSEWSSTRFIFAANVFINQYTKRPFIVDKPRREYFFIRRFYLVSMGIANWNSYKENNLFNPNRFSYLPRGLNANVTMGIDYFERQRNKLLISAAINYSIFPKKIGHLFAETKATALLNRYGNNEYTIQLQLNYISPLYTIKKWHIRYFIYNKMQLAYNKPKDIPYTTNAIIGYSNRRAFYSSQNYTFNFEPAVYCPYTVAGFNFSFFAFADIGIFGINNRNDALLSNREISQAYGGGLRINNPDLGLGFIEVSFAYYPSNISDYNFNYQIPVSFTNRKQYMDYNLFDPDYTKSR